MAEEKQEHRPTLEITNCPSCGSNKRLANEVLKGEILKGKLPELTQTFIFTHESIIAKPTGWLSAPMIITYFDVCMDCGTVYCIHADVITAVAGSKPKHNIPPMKFSSS